MTLRTLAVLGALACAACVNGADSCFRPASIVDGPRVLALRADPPDQVVDLDAGPAPSVSVRALVAGQLGTTRLRLGGRLCAPTPSLRCLDGSLEVPIGDQLAIGEAGTSFTVPLELLRAARDADPLKGYGGIRVQLDAVAYVDDQELHAAKTLIFQLAGKNLVPNHGFELDGLTVAPLTKVDDFYSDEHGFRLEVNATYGLRPHVVPGPGAAEAAETYEIDDLQDNRVTLRETISYSFFTTEKLIYGDLHRTGNNLVARYVIGADVADEPPPGTADTPEGLVRLNALYPIDTTLWVVARDGRGAVSWKSYLVTVRWGSTCNEGRCPDLRIFCRP